MLALHVALAQPAEGAYILFHPKHSIEEVLHAGNKNSLDVANAARVAFPARYVPWLRSLLQTVCTPCDHDMV